MALAFVLTACGGGGDPSVDQGAGEDVGTAAVRSSVGPGDTERLWPIELGNTWQYDVQELSNVGIPSSAYTSTLSVTHSEAVGDTTTVRISESSTDPSEPRVSVDEYFIDRGGVTFVSTSTSSLPEADALVRQVGAYRDMLFPMQLGSIFVAFDKSGLDFGLDFDGDGINEVLDLRMTTTMAGHEAVTVPAGAFERSAKYRKLLVQRLTLSRDRRVMVITTESTHWYVSGTGLVKVVMATSSEEVSFSTVYQLRSYRVAGVAGGLASDEDGYNDFVTYGSGPRQLAGEVRVGPGLSGATLTVAPVDMVNP